MEDLTTAETGEWLGLTDAYVKIRLFRAKNILRRTLRQLHGRGPVADVARLRDSGPGIQTAESQIRSGVGDAASWCGLLGIASLM